MICRECSHEGAQTPAVALCQSCSAGLCEEHLRQAAHDLRHQMYGRCTHTTWSQVEGEAGVRAL